jgi:hypothetical protein
MDAKSLGSQNHLVHIFSSDFAGVGFLPVQKLKHPATSSSQLK